MAFWHPTEAEKIFELSQAYGVPIEAVEFANEPNMLEDTGFPKGYTAAHYRRDQDLFFQWLEEHYPNCLKVGPSSKIFSASVGCQGSSAECKPGQLAIEIFKWPPTALTKSRTPIHCSLVRTLRYP